LGAQILNVHDLNTSLNYLSSKTRIEFEIMFSKIVVLYEIYSKKLQ
jgi:hypothetical protein